MTSQTASPLPPPGSTSGRAARYAAMAAIATALLAGAIFLAARPKAKTPSTEVDRAQLVLVEGRLCRQNDTNLFTGIMTEHYPDGMRQSRSSLSNGLLEGVSEGWYTNGQRQVLEHFSAGVSHGLRTKWYPTGLKLSEANIVHGKIEGVFRRWHENGVLAEEIPMNAGKPDGVSRAYDSTGHLKAEVRLRAGEVLEQKFLGEDRKPSPGLTGTQAGFPAPGGP